MKIIYNEIISLGGFKAMALWPFIFAKSLLSDEDRNHEEIHGRQQVETLFIGFAIVYLLSWLVELVWCAFDKERGQVTDQKYKKRNYVHRVEHSIIFEREAYTEQGNKDYLKNRPFWAWLKY